jgi:predicted nucleic acid-binding Zn ribbon protein
MQELKAEKPTESPAGSDPVTRLMARLGEEGFTTDQNPEDWEEFGEIIFRRSENISFAKGETVFIFTRVEDVNERVLRQTSDSVVNTYKAKDVTSKALSVLQSTTVYHCLVCTTEQPHNEMLNDFITRSGGATFIPVVIVPEINQVVYPNLEEKIGSYKPRVEYLQYLLGERRDNVNMHKQTVQAFYISMGVVALLVVAIVASFFMK